MPSNISTGREISLLELKARSCRWPNGDPKKAGFSFCGEESLAGLPYCAEHAAVAYQGSAKKFAIHVDENVDEIDEEKAISSLS